jgi:hypothetical protein
VAIYVHFIVTINMQQIIDQYDKEINRLNRKIKETGLAKEMSERILSQCVNVRGITSNEELDRIFDTDAERED